MNSASNAEKALRKFSRIHLVPEPFVRFLSSALKYDSLGNVRFSGHDLIKGILNFFAILSLPVFPLILVSPLSGLVALMLLTLFSAMLIVLYPRLHLSSSAASELKNSLFSLDIFSTVYFLTGSVELAASYLAGRDSETSRCFRKVLLRIRNGTEPKGALLSVFPAGVYHEWIKSVTYGSLSNTKDMVDAWRAQALKNLSKTEDATAFIILISSLLPMVTALVFLVCGAGSSPLIFMPVMLNVAEFLGVYLWLKNLVSPLE